MENVINKHKPNFEKNYGKTMTVKTGYVPLEQQIKRIMQSGENISDYWAGLYDYYGNKNGDIDWNSDKVQTFLDPTRRKDFDIIDAQELQKAIQMRVKNRAEFHRLERDRDRYREWLDTQVGVNGRLYNQDVKSPASDEARSQKNEGVAV